METRPTLVAALRLRLASAQTARRQRASDLLGKLEQQIARPDTNGSPGVPSSLRTTPTPDLERWLRRGTGVAIGAPAFERGLLGRFGPDVFGQWPLLPRADDLPEDPDPATTLVGKTDTADCARVASLLRALSLTRCDCSSASALPDRDHQKRGPAAHDSHDGHGGHDGHDGAGYGDAGCARHSPDLAFPARIIRYRRSEEERRWGQAESEKAPPLPEHTVIPRVVHSVWLGGPLPEGDVRRNLAAGARCYAGRFDFVLWTDLGRAETVSALAGQSGQRAEAIRSLLAWAREHRISLIDWREVFDPAHPALAHDQIVAQSVLTPEPGYAGAGAQLGLEVIARFGGIHIDGDIPFVGNENQLKVKDLNDLIKQVASSPLGLAVQLTEQRGIRQIIVAPAGHPGVRLWQDLFRLARTLRLPDLLGGAEPLAERYAGRLPELRWRRDLLALQTARAQQMLLRRIGPARKGMVRLLNDGHPGGSPASLIGARRIQVSEGENSRRVKHVITFLIRQLEIRKGDLHLTAVAPTISALPEPEAAWIAVLHFLVVLAERGVIRPVTSVTRFRWGDDGEAEYVRLPPEAETMLEYVPAPDDWLGRGVVPPDRSLWVMDELVAPAALRRRSSAAFGLEGGTDPDLLVPSGVAGLTLHGRLGVLWHGERRVRPEDAALYLAARGLLGRPVWVWVTGESEYAVACFSEDLAALIGRPVTVIEGQFRARSPKAGRGLGGQDPERLLAGLRARAAAAKPVVWSVPIPPEPELTWLRTVLGQNIYRPEFEVITEHQHGPDIFGVIGRLLGQTGQSRGRSVLPELTRAGAELVAPVLRRMSLTRDPGSTLAAALTEVKAGRERGVVARHTRTAQTHEWSHSDTPPLPAEIVIPKVVHAIWLGGPVPEGGLYRSNIGDGAERYSGQIDFVLWTDLTRSEVRTAQAGGGGLRGSRIRSTLDWAARCGITLVNVFEVFGPDDPLPLGREFAREYIKGLPRGYGAASDVLRQEIVATFGGLYTDGDNCLTAADRRPLLEIFEAVAASRPAFTLNFLGNGRINNDVVVAPAGHPALRLVREVLRQNFRRPQSEVLGGPRRMSQRFVGRRGDLLRYSTVRRTGRCHHVALHHLGYYADDQRPVRPMEMIREGTELSWGRPPTDRLARTEEETLDRLEEVITTLARHLVNREGDLYLSEMALVVDRLPDPAAAWTAVLRFLAELQEAGRISPVRSVTEIRHEGDGTLRQVDLPPAAEACLERPEPAEVSGKWLGEGVFGPGEPVWLQDEVVAPARLRMPLELPPLPARPVTEETGGIVGWDLTGLDPVDLPLTGSVPPGWLGIWLTPRWGEAQAGGYRVRETELAERLTEHSGPIVLFPVAGVGGLEALAERLAQRTGQVVTVVTAPAV